MKRILLPLLGFSLALFSSCQKLLIKPDPKSSSEQNFEMFWNDVYNGYPYFVEDNIDWKARYDQTRPSITSGTSTEDLYTKMTGMLKGFSDGHLSVSYGSDNYSNEKTIDQYLLLVRADANGTSLPYPTSYDDVRFQYYNEFDQINRGYITPNTYETRTAPSLENPGSTDNVCIFGMIKNSTILYLNLPTFLTDAALDDIMLSAFAEYPNATGLILDLRMNGGGNLGTMWDAMALFLPSDVSEVTYAYNKEKVGPLPENFGPEKYFAITNHYKGTPFLKPIVVLVNKLTVSAAEHATMALKEIQKYNTNLKVIGDYTFGATSFVIQRTLPCGITYTLVNSKTWDINHVIVERTGVQPNQQVFITSNDVQNQKDSQMEAAIAILKGNLF